MSGSPDIAVICGFYNFPGFVMPQRNLHRFVRYVHSLGVECYGVELYHTAPVTNEYRTWQRIQCDDRYILWQKEGLWNVAERLVPPHVNKIVCCDTDIWWTEPKIMRFISEALDTFKVVQPFGRAHQTGATGRVVNSYEASLTLPLAPRGRHPGYAMAFQRSLWREAGGVFDGAIGGNGDWFLTHSIIDEDPETAIQFDDTARRFTPLPECYFEDFRPWCKKFKNWLTDSWTMLPYDVIHEYHGKVNDRQYMTRRRLLTGLVHDEYERDQLGLWHWTDKANVLRRDGFKNFFINRKEDS